jgi:magnesium chelatase family protein
MHVTVGAVALRTLASAASAERSASVRSRVEEARTRQHARFASMPHVSSNARAPGRWMESRGGLTREARELAVSAAERLGLTARAYHRVLRVARTIADLDGESGIVDRHVAEALRYRPVAEMRERAQMVSA